MIETHFANRPPAIAILGAGVVGLTTAMALRERWPEAAITIYARDCDPKGTTSWVAGGQFAPASTLCDSDGAHLDASERHIEELERRGLARRYGIARRTAYSLDGGGGGTLLRLGKASRTAREYTSLLIDPTRLLPALNTDLAGRGVRFVTRELLSRGDVYALAEPIVVNCTGFGARDLFGDDTIEARRGHIVLLRNTASIGYFLNSWCGSGGRIRYLFGRHDDIVIGGSIRPGADVASYDPDIPDDVTTCRRLLANARALFEAPGESCA